jgi:toluene monooxygenase system protein D
MTKLTPAASDGKNMAGPLFRGGEMASSALEAIRMDNPDKELEIVDHGSYVRVEAEGGLVIRRATMEQILGRPFKMQELEVNITGFSGKIETDENQMRWYFKRNISSV